TPRWWARRPRSSVASWSNRGGCRRTADSWRCAGSGTRHACRPHSVARTAHAAASRGAGAPGPPGSSEAPDDAAHDAADLHLVDVDRLHLRVGRLQPHAAVGLAVVALQGRFLVGKDGDDDVAVARRALALDDDEVAVRDVVLDHRVAAHLQQVVVRAGGNQLVEPDLSAILDRLDRP